MSWYKGPMTTLAGEPFPDPAPDRPMAAVAEAFFAALAAQDFARVASVFSDDVHLRALLPAALREWDGPAGSRPPSPAGSATPRRSRSWTPRSVSIGARLCLRWRVRLQAERIGPGWRVVEQQAYADVDGDRLSTLSLVCTGYLAEDVDG